MSVLSILALLGLALAALPIAIHMLVRRHAVRLDFPTLRFLRETPSFRVRPRRLQNPLLLAVRLAALFLLVLGFARPLFTFTSNGPAVRVVMLDASASMGARERSEAAKEVARDLIKGLGAGERAAIMQFSADVKLLSDVTADKSRLIGALETYRIDGGTTNFNQALRRANELLGRQPQSDSSIYLVSDFQRAELQRAQDDTTTTGMPARYRVIAKPVGAPLQRNAFFRDEAFTTSESGIEIVSTEIVATVDGQSAMRRSWNIGSSQNTQADIEWRTQANGQITARIISTSGDDFDADDERFLAFARPRSPSALLVESDDADANLYLRAALEAVPATAAASGDSGRSRLSVDGSGALLDDNSKLNSYALVVYTLREQPRAEDLQVLADFVREGGTLFLVASRDLDVSSWNEARERVGRALFPELKRKGEGTFRIGTADLAARELKGLESGVLDVLRGVNVRAGFDVATDKETDVLMRWSDGGSAMTRSRIGSGTVILFGTSPDRLSSDLGSSMSWPALVSSIARASLMTAEPPSYSVGEPVDVGEPASSTLRITDAAGKVKLANVGELMRRPEEVCPLPGVYRVESSERERFIAVNVPDAESTIPLATPEDLARRFGDTTTTPPTGKGAWRDASEGNGNAWRYFLAGVFVLLIAELLNRRLRREAVVGG